MPDATTRSPFEGAFFPAVPQASAVRPWNRSVSAGQVLRWDLADPQFQSLQWRTVLSLDNLPGDVVTVSLSRRLVRAFLQPPERLQSPEWRARLSWGAGGAEDRLLCDYSAGTVLSVPAQSLRVDVGLDSGLVAPGNEEYEFRALVGTEAGTGQIQGYYSLTRNYIDVLGVRFPVPPYARAVSLTRAIASTAYSLELRNGDGVTVANVPGTALQSGAAVPVPGACTYAAVSIVSPVNPDLFTLLWHLGV